MKTRTLVMAAVPLLAVPWVWAQSSTKDTSPDGSTGRLTRVTPSAQDETFDGEEWKKKLSAADLQEREDAFDRLAEVAARDPKARETLEAWSRDERDPALAWTSRLLLREVNRSPRGWLRTGTLPDWSSFGQSFDFDDFAHRFEDLDSMLGDLRTEWEGMLHALSTPSGSGGSTSSSHGLSLEVQPDGVKCKVTEKVDGEEKTREYTAKTLDELLEANPELRGKLGGRIQIGLGGLGGRHGLVIPDLSRGHGRITPRTKVFFGQDDDGTSGTLGAPRTDRLGIFCQPLGEEEAGGFGLEPGVGLRVQETQPGTIAKVLGLRSGDVVVEINGTTIRSADDVKRILGERAPEAEVSLVVVGSEGRRTLTWKPAPQPETKSGSRDL